MPLLAATVEEPNHTCDTHDDRRFLHISDAGSDAEGNILRDLEGDGLDGESDKDDLAGDEDEICDEDAAEEESFLTLNSDLSEDPFNAGDSAEDEADQNVSHDLPVTAMKHFCACK